MRLVEAGAIDGHRLAKGSATGAVVLSGSGTDGAMGVKAIKKMGGTVIVQDLGSSEFSGMPSAAVQTGAVDFILPLAEIAPALQTLVVSNATR